MQNTTIEWATHTFNPWIGCEKVSPGCQHCYAETLNARFVKGQAKAPNWGPGAPRRLTSDANWKQPVLWNQQAANATQRPRVFCASMADVFDPAVPTEWRQRLLQLIDDTPNLDWLLLTKRPEHIYPLMNQAMNGNFDIFTFKDDMPNVWLGITAENQEQLDQRMEHFYWFSAAKQFLSCEPLLGPLNIEFHLAAIEWVICGGESGKHSRPMEIEWAEDLQRQCKQFKIPFFMKQLGGYPNKRGLLTDFPPHLQVRQVPE